MSEQPQPYNYVDDDTLLRLKNVGSRVRKSVTEGFQRTVSVPADPFFATKRLPFTQTPSFISANDAMRDMLAQRAAARAQGSNSAPSSPQQRPKRILGGVDEDSDVEPLGGDGEADLDLDLDMTEDDATSASAVCAKNELTKKLREEKAKREIKPLRRSASRGVQSLPPSMFRFSHETGGSGGDKPAVASIAEEEDWSGNFGGSGGSVTAVDLEL